MKKKIFVRGPVLSQSGYGEQSRFALRALKSREDLFDVFIQPLPWGQTGWIWEESEFREWMDSRIKLTQVLLQKKQLQPDISLQISIPNEFQKLAPINIGYTAGIETDKVAPVWLQKGNEMDKILVVSNHAKSTYANTTVFARTSPDGEDFKYSMTKPIDVVWEKTPKAEPQEIPNLNLDYDFNFLMVSQMGARKNFNNALSWWVEEFIDQEVGLVVKTNIRNNSNIDWEYMQKQMSSMLSKYPDRKCKVYLLHGDLSSGQMAWLYRNDKIKSLVNIAHGEGFGLPMFEAAREGLPIVTIGWSGQVDFLTHDGKDYFQPVQFTLQPIQKEAHWEGVLQKESNWAFADQGSYKMVLRKTYKNWDDAKKLADELIPIIEDKFSDETLFAGFVNAINSDEVDIDDWLEELSGDLEEYD